ncbi:MAG: hypothetical protein EYC68_14440 [Chloroflexota bacterium]|nr:MAG: hypothetical protein EYC68_14440 [Chloroflexota bacterium]
MTQEFDLYVDDPRELFVFHPQTYDPFDENALGEPGLDYMVARMIGFWFTAPNVRTRVYLPPEKLAADTEARMRRAMRSWCEDLLVANQRERAEFLVNGSIFLVVAIVVLIVNWFVQNEIITPQRVPDDTLRSAFSYGLDVVVWVALWAPISAFLLEWFPLFRRHQAYKALRDMHLTVHPQPRV